MVNCKLARWLWWSWLGMLTFLGICWLLADLRWSQLGWLGLVGWLRLAKVQRRSNPAHANTFQAFTCILFANISLPNQVTGWILESDWGKHYKVTRQRVWMRERLRIRVIFTILQFSLWPKLFKYFNRRICSTSLIQSWKQAQNPGSQELHQIQVWFLLMQRLMN